MPRKVLLPTWWAPASNRLQCSSIHSAQRAGLHELWKKWTEECDADGRTDFYGLQHLAGLGLFEAGEIFVRIRPRRPSVQLPVPFQLQLLEAEMLDPTYQLELANGHVIPNGSELNQIGRRQAYWFWKQHPGDKTLLTGHGRRVRVPAPNVLHIFQAKARDIKAKGITTLQGNVDGQCVVLSLPTDTATVAENALLQAYHGASK